MERTGVTPDLVVVKEAKKKKALLERNIVDSRLRHRATDGL